MGFSKTPEELKRLQEEFPEGSIVQLFSMEGEPQMPFGVRGRVEDVDSIGQVHVRWANGSSLALNPEVDKYEVVLRPEPDRDDR